MIIISSLNTALAYVWLRNGVAIPNSNNKDLVVNTTGNYRLVTIENTCTDTSDIINVAVSPNPTVDLGNDYSICVGDATVLDAGIGNSVLWDNNTTNSLRTVTQAGTYSVLVTNNFGCVASDTIIISKFAIPQPQLGNDTMICIGERITLQAGNFNAYNWSTNANTPTISVVDSGTYHVTVVDNNGCKGSDTVNVDFYPNATTEGFSFIPYFYEEQGKVKFYAINPQFVNSYRWEFGDGGTSNVANPMHKYLQNGQYDVKLYVTHDPCLEVLYEQRITIDFSTSIDKIDNAINAKLYPNPAQDKFTIVFDIVNIKIDAMKVIDGLGRMHELPFEVGNASMTVNTQQLTSGIYTILLQTDKGSYQTKFEILK